MVTVRRYRKGNASAWNTFATASANATFLLDRRYMDYHKDRFRDHSLMLYDDLSLIAILPANESKTHIASHGGLTYGGLIVAPATKLLTTLSCFYAITKYYHRNGFKKILYKPVPSFLHSTPYYQDTYALFLLKSKITALNTGFVADLSHPPTISSRRMRMVRKAQKHGITVERARDCKAFWKEILVPHLTHRFGAKPVHSEREIEMLRKRFPGKILQYHAVKNGASIAGVTIFLDRGVAHSQYIAGSNEGRDTGALDYLFLRLVTHEFKNQRYFSFGTTNMGSPDGKELSRGLAEWKEGFGATMFPYPCYDIETKNYRTLEAYR